MENPKFFDAFRVLTDITKNTVDNWCGIILECLKSTEGIPIGYSCCKFAFLEISNVKKSQPLVFRLYVNKLLNVTKMEYEHEGNAIEESKFLDILKTWINANKTKGKNVHYLYLPKTGIC